MKYDQILNKTVQSIPPSGIRKFFDIVAEMKDAISLGVGEPDFNTPWNICEAAVYALENGVTHYSSNWGTPKLRAAIADYEQTRFGVTYDPKDEIIVTVGASEGIDLALRALITPGDEVLIPDPSYVSYMPCVRLSGGVAVPLETNAENGFKIMPEALKKAITPRTKVLIFPYPNNPTGGIMSREEQLRLIDILRDTNIIVLADEIYAELTYGGEGHCSFASLPGMWERTVTLNGFSKAFAMTGWRLGYLCAPKELAKAMCKIHQYTMLCAPVQGQAAAVEALTSGKENGYASVQKMRDIYDRRRRLLLEGFSKMGLSCFEPLGAFYVFPCIRSTGLSSEVFCERLLREEKVATVPGTAFGQSGEGFVRCSYATATDQIQEAIVRMDRFVRKIRAEQN